MKNATNIFLRIMIKVLKGWEDKKFKCFLINQTFTTKHGHKHLQHMWNVFQRLRVVNLKQNRTKCCFVSKNIIFLSHVVCEVGTQHDPSKVKDIVEFLILKIVFNVTSILGWIRYCRMWIFGMQKLLYLFLNYQNEMWIWSIDEGFECSP
jgi:hypothetical protein